MNPTARGLFFTESCAKPCRCLFDFHYKSKGLGLAINYIVFFVLRSQNMDSIVNYMGLEILQPSTGTVLLMPIASCYLLSLCGTYSGCQGQPALFSSVMWSLCLMGQIPYWHREYWNQRGDLHSIWSSLVLLFYKWGQWNSKEERDGRCMG